MFNSVKVENRGGHTVETFAINQHFIARYHFMGTDEEAPIQAAGTDYVSFYILGGALIVTYFEPGSSKEHCTALTIGTNFEIPAHSQFYIETGSEQSAEFIEVRKGIIV